MWRWSSVWFLLVCCTEDPQGTVLSLIPFTLYTSDFQYKSRSSYLQKYSDNSVVVEHINDGQRRSVEH